MKSCIQNVAKLYVTSRQCVCVWIREEGSGLVTNFISDRPSSWFSELYKADDLRGGHAIMLGPDEQNR